MAARASLSFEQPNLPNYPYIQEPPESAAQQVARLAVADTGRRGREKLGVERRCAIALKTWFDSLE